MIKHIVAWNFREEFSDEEKNSNARKVKNDLEGLKNSIPEIVELKIIINPLSTSHRNVILYSTFRSEEDLQKYQTHPEHKKVSEFVGNVMKQRLCLDFDE